MYQELHKWEESIQVAETKQHPEVATLKANYFQWLAETGVVDAFLLLGDLCPIPLSPYPPIPPGSRARLEPHHPEPPARDPLSDRTSRPLPPVASFDARGKRRHHNTLCLHSASQVRHVTSTLPSSA